MLRVMLNKDDTKRKAVQSVMQDRSLSALERNKKIQDVMAGKVVLLRVVATKELASTASHCQSHREKRNAESPESEEYSRRNDIDRANSQKGVYSSNINDAKEAETQGLEIVDSNICHKEGRTRQQSQCIGLPQSETRLDQGRLSRRAGHHHGQCEVAECAPDFQQGAYGPRLPIDENSV